MPVIRVKGLVECGHGQWAAFVLLCGQDNLRVCDLYMDTAYSNYMSMLMAHVCCVCRETAHLTL
jgi:hypothetical protein